MSADYNNFNTYDYQIKYSIRLSAFFSQDNLWFKSIGWFIDYQKAERRKLVGQVQLHLHVLP